MPYGHLALGLATLYLHVPLVAWIGECNHLLLMHAQAQYLLVIRSSVCCRSEAVVPTLAQSGCTCFLGVSEEVLHLNKLLLVRAAWGCKNHPQRRPKTRHPALKAIV